MSGPRAAPQAALSPMDPRSGKSARDDWGRNYAESQLNRLPIRNANPARCSNHSSYAETWDKASFAPCVYASGIPQEAAYAKTQKYRPSNTAAWFPARRPHARRIDQIAECRPSMWLRRPAWLASPYVALKFGYSSRNHIQRWRWAQRNLRLQSWRRPVPHSQRRKKDPTGGSFD
jgi:hypothetical protein